MPLGKSLCKEVLVGCPLLKRHELRSQASADGLAFIQIWWRSPFVHGHGALVDPEHRGARIAVNGRHIGFRGRKGGLGSH